MALRRDSHITLYMQLARQIEREIASGKYSSHERLPTEQQFVDALGVSRITVRQALKHLAEGGLIVKKQGKGTFVAGPVVRHELQELRGILEEITSQGIEPETRLLHFGPATAPAGTLEELRVNAKELVLLERLYSLQGAPIGLARTYFAPLFVQSHLGPGQYSPERRDSQGPRRNSDWIGQPLHTRLPRGTQNREGVENVRFGAPAGL